MADNALHADILHTSRSSRALTIVFSALWRFCLAKGIRLAKQSGNGGPGAKEMLLLGGFLLITIHIARRFLPYIIIYK